MRDKEALAVSFDYQCVAFVDILGFAALVEADSVAPKPTNLPRILAGVGTVRDIIDSAPGAQIQTFSDSVIASVPFSPGSFVELLEAVAALQRGFLGNGLAVRGGISYGKHYDDGQVLYSAALVSAYRIESARARVPRVVVDANLVDHMKDHADTTNSLRDRMSDLLLQDKDGQVFIHYLDESGVDAHKAMVRSIEDASRRAGSPSMLEKYLWLVEYHNHVASAQGWTEHLVEDGAASITPLFG